MEVFISLVALFLTLLYLLCKYQQSYWQRRSIPHEKPHFPLGNIVGWRKTRHFIDLFAPVYEKFKGSAPFAGFYFMLRPTVIALDMELIKNILIKDFNNFDERGIFHNARDDPLTGNLFQIDGQKWRPLRHKLSPTFTSGKMKLMFPTVLRVGEEFARVFQEKLEQEQLKDGVDTLEVTDMLSRFTADVIGSCAFGLECNSLRNPNAEFCTIGKRVLTERRHGKIVDTFIESFPVLARQLRLRQLHQDHHDFYMRIVRDTIDYRERNNIKRNDFMNILIEMKNNPDAATGGLSVEDIAAQCFLFFLAGFETSSTTMGFALYELAQHQDMQDRLRAEVNEVLAKNNDEFTYECMKDMPYMEQVMSETLRKYPILPQLARKAQQNYPTSDPHYTIDKGLMVIIPVYSIHHDPAIYPEPEKFDPERFTEAAIKSRPACSWLPFGDGPRNCIGLRFGKMQTYIGLAFVLKNFKFSVCEQTKIPLSFVKANVLLSAEGGIHLKVERV